jgi:hypothetical protein
MNYAIPALFGSFSLTGKDIGFRYYHLDAESTRFTIYGFGVGDMLAPTYALQSVSSRTFLAKDLHPPRPGSSLTQRMAEEEYFASARQYSGDEIKGPR